MTIESRDFQELIDEIRQRRDELRVRAHLAKEELKDQWEEWQEARDELEARWEELEPKVKAVAQESASTAKNVLSALELAAEEVAEGYRRLRNRLR